MYWEEHVMDHGADALSIIALWQGTGWRVSQRSFLRSSMNEGVSAAFLDPVCEVYSDYR
jgi:hypothetical protein